MWKWLVDIDLRKSVPALSFISFIAGLFVVGNPPTMTFDHLMPASWIPTALQIAKLITLGAPALAGTHSLAATMSPRAADMAVKVGAIVLALFLLDGGTSLAYAQTKITPPKPLIEVGGPCNPLGDTRPECQAKGSPAPLGSASNDLNALWSKIQSASIADLQYAKSLSDAANTPGGKMRSACWGAWIAVVQAQQGVNATGPDGKPLGAKPDPALFTTAEQIAETVDSLQPTSPFMVACQPVANAFKMNVLQLVTMVVSGMTTLGALGVAIP